MRFKERLVRLVVGLIGVALVWSPDPALADLTGAQWSRVEVGKGERAFVAVEIDPKRTDRVFAATPRTVYASQDGGQSWQERFRAPGEARFSRIAIEASEQPAILAATDRGLYGSFNGGVRWSRVFRGPGEGEADCTHVAFHPAGTGRALLATRGGLFMSSDHGRHWKDVAVPPTARDVAHFAFDPRDPERLYLVTTGGVFVGSLNEGGWQQRLSRFSAEETEEVEEPEVLEAIETEEETGSLHHLSAIAVDPQHPATLYLAGSRGLERSTDGGMSWHWLTRTGLESSAISRVLLQAHSPLAIYAGTDRGVARYQPEQERWTVITQGLATSPVHDLAAAPQQLWAATGQGLYRFEVEPDLFGESQPPSPHELLANFSHEPTIAQVREAAIRYAEVHPDKIKRWRHRANLQAFLPELSFDFDRDENTFVTSRGSTIDPTTDRFLTHDDPSRSFDFSVKWDLGELIWNKDHTSIDVRSKLMVQLREDLVDEVTRTYFERRRLQVVLLTTPPTDPQTLLQKELRIQELTALIDGLTGGHFSAQLEVNGNH